MVKLTVVAFDSPKRVTFAHRPAIDLAPGKAVEIVVPDEGDDDDPIYDPPVFEPTIDLPTFETLDGRDGKVPRIGEEALERLAGADRKAVELQVGREFDARQLHTIGRQSRQFGAGLFVIAKD